MFIVGSIQPQWNATNTWENTYAVKRQLLAPFVVPVPFRDESPPAGAHDAKLPWQHRRIGDRNRVPHRARGTGCRFLTYPGRPVH